MSGLRAVRGGKEPIVAWRRGGWQSLPHLTDGGNGPILTRCGHEVILGYGIDAIVQTQVPSEMFIAVGCGSCRMALVRDLRDDLLAASPDLKAKLREQLRRLEWTEPS